MKQTFTLFIGTVLFTCFLGTNTIAQQRLQLVGDATRYGWSKDHGSPVTLNTENSSVFHYNAWLNSGSFKLLLSNADWVPSWGPGEGNALVKRSTYEDPDISFNIATAGNYSIAIDTTLMTYSITPMVETNPIPFNTLFMVGGASPNGWDIGMAYELTRNQTNPLEFSYDGMMQVGDFKFPINRYFDWTQDMFMRVSDTEMFLGTSPDSKWTINEAGNYHIVLNVSTLSISIQKNTTTLNQVLNESFPELLSNMVSNRLIFKSPERFSYEIYCISGVKITEGYTSDNHIDVTALKSGIYLVKAGNKIYKFLKE